MDEYAVEIERLFRMMFEDANERRLLLDAVDTLNWPLALRLLGVISSIPRMVLPLLLLVVLLSSFSYAILTRAQVGRWIPSQLRNGLSQWRRYRAIPHLGVAQTLCHEFYGWREDIWRFVRAGILNAQEKEGVVKTSRKWSPSSPSRGQDL